MRPYSAYMTLLKSAIALPDPAAAAKAFSQHGLPEVIKAQVGHGAGTALRNVYQAASEAKDSIQSMERFTGRAPVEKATGEVTSAYNRFHQAFDGIRQAH